MDNASLISLDLSSTSAETITLFMDETADDAIFDEILSANQGRPDVLRLVHEHPNTPDEARRRAAEMLSVPVLQGSEVAAIRNRAETRMSQEGMEGRRQRLVVGVQKMSVSEKIKLALRGNGEVRGLLIRDPNRLVVMNVLDNPKITEGEVETVARNRSVVDDALRKISKNKEWVKNYPIKLALATNPKTPAGIVMQLLPGLKKRDLALLEKNKNVSEAVRSTAKRLVKQKQS